MSLILSKMSKPKIISVRLYGGLGNQLFQFFAGLSTAASLGLNLYLDARWIELGYSHKNSDIRDFSFTENFKVKTTKEYGTLNLRVEQLKNRLACRSKLLSALFSINISESAGFIDLTGIRQGIELRGYYQSHRYFQNLLHDENFNHWSVKSETKLFTSNKLKFSESPFISVHVRGGDYLKKSQIYHTLDSDYYQKALKIVKEEIGDLDVYIFSDDVEHAKKILGPVPNSVYVSNGNMRASEVMILMSLGKALVIANSTFSYWAAMMNTGKLVLAPGKWFKTTPISSDLYPVQWRVLE